MIDRKILNEYLGSFDNEFIIQCIEDYLSSYQEEFITIRNNIIQKDLQKLSRATCRLRGTVVYFGDPVVTEQCRRLEFMTRNNNKIEDGLENLLDELDVNHGFLVEELKLLKVELIKDQK